MTRLLEKALRLFVKQKREFGKKWEEKAPIFLPEPRKTSPQWKQRKRLNGTCLTSIKILVNSEGFFEAAHHVHRVNLLRRTTLSLSIRKHADRED